MLDSAIPGLSEFTNVLSSAGSMMGGNPVDYASQGTGQSLGSEGGVSSGGMGGVGSILSGAAGMAGNMVNKVGKGLFGGLF